MKKLSLLLVVFLILLSMGISAFADADTDSHPYVMSPIAKATSFICIVLGSIYLFFRSSKKSKKYIADDKKNDPLQRLATENYDNHIHTYIKLSELLAKCDNIITNAYSHSDSVTMPRCNSIIIDEIKSKNYPRTIDIEDLEPNMFAMRLVIRTCLEMISSGKRHVYHGQLSAHGNSLLYVYSFCNQFLFDNGYISEEELQLSKEKAEYNISIAV